MEAALREHCPGTTLQDVRCWFLMLWLEIAGGALIMGLPRAPPVRRLMLIAQQALSSGLLSALEQARVVHVAGKAVYGAQLDAAFVQSPRGEKLVEFVEGGLALAERGRVYVKAAALSRELSMLLLVRSKGEAGEARAASLARIDKLTALRRRALGTQGRLGRGSSAAGAAVHGHARNLAPAAVPFQMH